MRLIIAGRNISQAFDARLVFLHRSQDRRLEPRKTKIIPAIQAGTRKRKRSRIPTLGGPLDHRSSRVSETQQARNLVKGLSRRIVDGPPQALILAIVLHQDQIGMSTGNDQAKLRKHCLESGSILRLAIGRCSLPRDVKPIGRNVRLQVVDADERQPPAIGQPFRYIDADQQ